MLTRLVLLLAAVAAATRATDAKHGHRQPITDEEPPIDEFAVGGPHCPPSVRPVSKGLCNVQKCFAHAECQSDADSGRLCCYNGCVYSCMLKMLPPLVFDWIDEDSEEKGSNGTIAEEPWSASHQLSSSEEENDEDEQDRAEANEPGHVIALPEGCVLTQKDYEQLLVFQKKDYVDKCYCKDGEVFCKVHGSRKT